MNLSKSVSYQFDSHLIQKCPCKAIQISASKFQVHLGKYNKCKYLFFLKTCKINHKNFGFVMLWVESCSFRLIKCFHGFEHSKLYIKNICRRKKTIKTAFEVYKLRNREESYIDLFLSFRCYFGFLTYNLKFLDLRISNYNSKFRLISRNSDLEFGILA